MKSLVEVTVDSKVENFEDFCPNYVQELSLCSMYILYSVHMSFFLSFFLLTAKKLPRIYRFFLGIMYNDAIKCTQTLLRKEKNDLQAKEEEIA